VNKATMAGTYSRAVGSTDFLLGLTDNPDGAVKGAVEFFAWEKLGLG
jgi:hypothetical protein